MQREIARILAAFALAVSLPAGASAQRNAVDSWDLSARDPARPPAEPALPADSRTASVEALNRILSSGKLSAFDRSVYLSIRAYQLNREGRQADSDRDIAEMGKVLPSAWQLVLSGTLPELAGGGDRAAALRTLESALQQKPGDAWLTIAQAQVYMQLADFPRARDLLDRAEAGASNPVNRRSAQFYRGLVQFNLGRYAEAAAEFDASLEGRTTPRSRLSPLLWRTVSLMRARQDGRAALARDLGGEPLDEWPGPLAAFLLGRLTPGALEVAAETEEAAKRANGRCASAFFLAMDALRRGDRTRAREQLQLTEARCPTISEFNWAASSELKRLP